MMPIENRLQQLATHLRLRTYNILLVEDDFLTAHSITQYLEEFNINVTHASNGNEAVRRYLERAYDLVISDFEMPNMNGLEFLQQIRSMAPLQKVIFVTAYSRRDIFEEALDNGAAAFYLKPIDLKRLKNEIIQILGLTPDRLVSRALFPLKIRTGSVNLHHACLEFSGYPGDVRLIDLVISRLPIISQERVIVSLRFDEEFALHKESLKLISTLVDDIATLLHMEFNDIELGGSYFKKASLSHISHYKNLLQCRILHD